MKKWTNINSKNQLKEAATPLIFICTRLTQNFFWSTTNLSIKWLFMTSAEISYSTINNVSIMNTFFSYKFIEVSSFSQVLHCEHRKYKLLFYQGSACSSISSLSSSIFVIRYTSQICENKFTSVKNNMIAMRGNQQIQYFLRRNYKKQWSRNFLWCHD